jgi:class 3 adenylate cyclase/tetratricopeptide (TPR) repeat protein
MHCPSCGFENPEGMKFCGECGAPLTGRCPQCGFENPPRFKFCGGCGAPLSLPAQALSPAPVLPPSAEPVRYTPTYLAEKIVASRSALEGERKQVTVLFADLKGSMELLADRDPEEARQLLDPVLKRMMAAVHRYEGTVNQVMGDGIMALFGAPIAHEEHAIRACYAALAMQAAIRTYAEEARRAYGITVQMRVGLNSGAVVVRAIGNDLHMDYSAVGQTTHLAARMEQLATPGSILLTADTLRLVEGLVQVTALGSIPVKGLSEPVEAIELVGASTLRGQFQAKVAGGLTRFVGRQTERAAIVQALERAGAGHGQVVALVGEAGVGKSRLVYECVHAHHLQGWRVLESASASYGKATPYFPVIDLLRRYTHVEERDDVRTIRAKVTGQVLTLDETLQETLPALLALLDAVPDDSPFLQLDPPQRRQRTLDALKRVLVRENQVQPLLLVFEDLHWIDAETQALLDSLVESLPMARLLLLVNYRPEYQHGWGSKTYYTQLRLDPLPPASADEFLQALLGNDPSLAPLKRLLSERTEGNPFFLEESVRTLVETGVLVGEPGAYRLAQAVPTIQVPATVHAVLAARIDRLPADDKHLLQSAAVIGTEVPVSLLQAITALPDAALYRSLAHLQAAELLYETRLFPEREYTFKHALTHEVTYGSLLHERKRTLHARIMEALEPLAADQQADAAERLAYHALRGEVWDKALVHVRNAGDKAAARSANREAVAHFEQALVASQHLPECRDRSTQALDLYLRLHQALFPLGEFDRALHCLDKAETLAESLGDQQRLGRILGRKGLHCWAMGDYQRAIAMCQRALGLASARHDVALQVPARDILGRTYYTLGNYPRAIEVFTENMAALSRDLERERFGRAGIMSVTSRHFLGVCQAEMGMFAEANTYAEEAVRIAEAADHPHSLVTAYACAGQLALYRGHLPKAVAVFERALAVCQDANIQVWLPILATWLPYAYALMGRSTEAMELMALLEQTISQRSTGQEVSLHTRLSETYLLVGRLADAHTLAQRVLDRSRTQGEQGNQAWVLRLLGNIALGRQPLDTGEVETYYHLSLTLAETLGMRPLQAHCHLSLGTMEVKRGRPEHARVELSTAIALYRAMEMTFWLPQAEATLAQVEGR